MNASSSEEQWVSERLSCSREQEKQVSERLSCSREQEHSRCSNGLLLSGAGDSGVRTVLLSEAGFSIYSVFPVPESRKPLPNTRILAPESRNNLSDTRF